MQFAIVTEAIPNPSSAGGELANWSLIKYLRQQGQHVTVCVLNSPSKLNSPEKFNEYIKDLLALGARVHCLDAPNAVKSVKRRDWCNRLTYYLGLPRVFFNPMLNDYYPSISLASTIKKILRESKPDAVYVFDAGPIAALEDFREIPRMASLSDPIHLTKKQRLKFQKKLSLTFVVEYLRWMGIQRNLPRQIVSALRSYESVGWFSAHHAEGLRQEGIACMHLHVPVVDQLNPIGAKKYQERCQDTSGKIKLRILMVGNLSSTANLSGLYPFADEILPKLQDHFDIQRLEIHLVGRGTLPEVLRKRLSNPFVVFRGYVEDLAEEFYSSDIFLAPMDYKVGIRSRILTALSFGVCVVSHDSSALGIPELKHGENCLLGSNPQELAEHLLMALRSGQLRARLAVNARRTYEKYFAIDRAGALMLSELKRITLTRAKDLNGSICN